MRDDPLILILSIFSSLTTFKSIEEKVEKIAETNVSLCYYLESTAQVLPEQATEGFNMDVIARLTVSTEECLLQCLQQSGLQESPVADYFQKARKIILIFLI